MHTNVDSDTTRLEYIEGIPTIPVIQESSKIITIP